MGLFQLLTFTTPAALAALALLPVIWWLLRFTPPRPQTVRFPPLRLLLELVNREEQPDRTPWWLMLLRLLIATLVILGVSHPFYAPGHLAAVRSDPLLLVVDDSWAAAPDWDKRKAFMSEILDGAKRAGAVVTLAASVADLHPQNLESASAQSVASRLAALEPKALDPDRPGLLSRLKVTFKESGPLRIVWMSDGVDDGSAKNFAEGLTQLAGGKASVEAVVPKTSQLPLALAAPGFDAGRIKITALRASDISSREAKAIARSSNGRSLGEVSLKFNPASAKAEGYLDLPIELRNEVERIDIDNQRNAAASFLFDDRWRRKSIGLQSGQSLESAQPLLSPLYYVSRALEPYAELAEPTDLSTLKQSLDAGLSMLVLADIGVMPDDTRILIKEWVAKGGALVRFAGPRLAGALTGSDDDLIPVTLREGGRSLGSALSWETPQAMQAFANESPFVGLTLDQTIRIGRQVLAEPDADLPGKVWAMLEDGTPLVTARKEGKGLIVLFHVTANADWSNLPLTGLFVEMLRRVLDQAPAAGAGGSSVPSSTQAEAAGFAPYRILAGTGDLLDPSPDIKPIAASLMDRAKASPETPAGLYRRGSQQRAINIVRTGDALLPITGLPSTVAVRSLAPLPALALAPYLFATAFLLFLMDCLAALMLSGGWSRLRTGPASAAILMFLLVPNSQEARADALEEFALRNALDTHLAYVLTGDQETDRISEAGMDGLDVILRDRTSVEPGPPVGINIERDELVFFPLLYWPVRAEAAIPSDAALAKMDAYMKNGGTIFFDLREDGASTDVLTGGTSGAADTLRRMLAKLDIPPLEPVPPEHVLTKSFYLMDLFPGRYDQGSLWVERTDPESVGSGNADGVSSIIIGSNDYAGAWAIDDSGQPLLAVIPGIDRQREMAYRAGINVIMYALTGNYKADQVHIPALLERLGQ